MAEARPNFKLHPKELYISTSLMNNIISHSTVKKVVIEETTSELWYETYNGPGTIKFKNNMKYTGNLHYGLINNADIDNPCTIIFPNGTKYIGTMINNEITGQGKYLFKNGSTYTGDVLNGLRHGKGTFETEEGIIYEGEWKDGLKHGQGKLIQGNMEIEGQWIEGIIQGKCRIKWKSGNVYDGQISENKMEGNGYMIWNNKNEKYVGKWQDNLQNGLGIYIWYDDKISFNKFFKDRYVGEWKEGKKDGYGKFFYSNGTIYEGFWKEDKKEGFGILSFQDRTNISGLFQNDIFLTDLKDANKYLKQDSAKPKKIDNAKRVTITKNKKPRRSSYLMNVIRPPIRVFERQRTKVINADEIGNELKKEDIKDNKDNKEKEDDKNKNNQDSKEKDILKIISSLDEIKIKISIDDISLIENFQKETFKNIDDLILRNVSLISRFYMLGTWGEDKLSEMGFSAGSPSMFVENKSMFIQQLQTKKSQNEKDDKDNLILNEEKKDKKEKKIYISMKDNIYSNDLYFCLDFKNFWKLLRECGIVNPKLSLAMIDRFIFKNPENEINMFYIPEEIEKLNMNPNKTEEIYNYLYQIIINSKKIYEIKNQAKIDLSTKILNKLNRQKVPDSDYLQKKEEIDKMKMNNTLNYHDEKNVILLRYFYEILIRLAYLYFEENINFDIETRVKIFFDIIKTFLKSHRKGRVDSSFITSFIDPKLKNLDEALDNYIYTHYEILKNIFNELCKLYCNYKGKIFALYDMTLTYRFFWEKIILNSEKLSELFDDKMLYFDLISYNFKIKKITSKNNLNYTEHEMFEYIEAIYDYEMIFREFCELIFYISRKFFIFYNIETKYEDSKGGFAVKEEPKKNEDEKIKKKKKTRKVYKNFDIYMLILDEINTGIKILKEKKIRDKIDIYSYPVLKTHRIIENYENEKRRKEMEEKRRQMDILRYNNERKLLDEEDVNMYKDDESNRYNSDYESSEDEQT